MQLSGSGGLLSGTGGGACTVLGEVQDTQGMSHTQQGFESRSLCPEKLQTNTDAFWS